VPLTGTLKTSVKEIGKPVTEVTELGEPVTKVTPQLLFTFSEKGSFHFISLSSGAL
jgi:hypothetical protein